MVITFFSDGLRAMIEYFHWKNIKTGFQKKDFKHALNVAGMLVYPLLISYLFRDRELFSFSFMGVLFTYLADPGGLYHIRFRTMIISSLLFVAANLVSAASAGFPSAVICLTLIWTFCAGMINIFGGRGTRISAVSIISIIMFIAKPAAVSQLTQISIIIFSGSIWVAVLKLWSWPFRRSHPLFNMTADYYVKLNQFFTAELWNKSSSSEDYHNGSLNPKRADLQRTRNMAYLMIRDLRKNYNGLAKQNHLLLQKADLLSGILSTISESIRHVPPGENQTLQKLIEEIIDTAGGISINIAESIRRQIAVGEKCRNNLNNIFMKINVIIKIIQEDSEKSNDYKFLSEKIFLVKAAERYLTVLQDIINIINNPGYEQPVRSSKPGEQLSFISNTGILLKENLKFNSQILRHSLRISVTLAVLCGIVIYADINNGYWIPLTAAIILKPDFHATKERAFERIGGTVAGGILAVVTAILIHNHAILYLFIMIFIFLAFKFRSQNYGLYAFFWTPVIVLLIDSNSSGNWNVAAERTIYSFTGGILALTSIYYFLPQWEISRITDYLSKALSSNRRFGSAVLARYCGEKYTQLMIEQIRQESYREIINTAAAFGRLLKEPGLVKMNTMNIGKMIEYNNRVYDVLSALCLIDTDIVKEDALPAMRFFLRKFNDDMQLVEATIASGREQKSILMRQSDYETTKNKLEELFISDSEHCGELLVNIASNGELWSRFQLDLFLPQLVNALEGLMLNSKIGIPDDSVA